MGAVAPVPDRLNGCPRSCVSTCRAQSYAERYSNTALKITNGGGHVEVAAAHIRPVEANSPGIVSNGLALLGTAHWMFDHGLISLSDDLSILVSRQANDPDSVPTLVDRTWKASALL
ncbi:HNH endonuclease [Methylobacterium sp. SD21]|uniref:HNH endonuclease n=1 Tax=Methylobacterium litchii TaxID=3138810 RepID=UPI00313C902F